MRFLILTLLLVSCGLFKTEKPRESKVKDSTKIALRERAAFFCDKTESLYHSNLGNVEPAGRCDGALFTSLHSLLCSYVTVVQFEDEKNPGKLCRDAECRCFYGDWESKAGFSKDMAIAFQLALAVHPDLDLVDRVIEYGEKNAWVVCDAVNEVEKGSKCIMSPKIIGRWYDLQGRKKLVSQTTGEGEAIGLNTEFQAHLDIISIMSESELYGAISPTSKRTLKEQWKRVKANGLFHASYSRFVDNSQGEIAARALLEKFPSDRLPNNRDDWCDPYPEQRDPSDKDWAPCPNETFKEHPATDFIFTAWILLNE